MTNQRKVYELSRDFIRRESQNGWSVQYQWPTISYNFCTPPAVSLMVYPWTIFAKKLSWLGSATLTVPRDTLIVHLRQPFIGQNVAEYTPSIDTVEYINSYLRRAM